MLFRSGAVEAVLDRVGHLVDDLDHIEDAVDEAPRSEPFDLTAVVPPAPVSPDERIPDHGPSGPAVDLFATDAMLHRLRDRLRELQALELAR